MDRFHIIMVGHVDHGKSTLIGRLLFDTGSLPSGTMVQLEKRSGELGREPELAFVTDQFHEERLRGVTIDTAQAFFHKGEREYVLIDAPGHVEFVRNMVTGATQAEGAVLVVDVREGVREQSRRHMVILRMFGIKRVIVIVNKMDLADWSEKAFKTVSEEALSFLSEIGIEPVCCIPVSALRGDNVVHGTSRMGWYGGPVFLEALDGVESESEAGFLPFIMPVQDVYSVDSKRVVVGKVCSGVINTGDTVEVRPGERETLIRTIEVFSENGRKSGSAGEAIGITTVEPGFVRRGQVLCARDHGLTETRRVAARLFWLSKEKLTPGQELCMRLATCEVRCERIRVISSMDSSTLETVRRDTDTLENLDTADVVINTVQPFMAAPFKKVPELGRFVLTQNGRVCAGGTVLNTEAPDSAGG